MKRKVFKEVLEQIKLWSPKVTHSVKSPEPERISWIIEHCGDALTSSSTCLLRALTGFIIFRKQGFDVTLQIGMRRIIQKAPMEAHAWLEIDGKIIMGYLQGMNKFIPFETIKGLYL
ncbi:MAG: lasso peptide biosynthesis B2 protein [Spirochaetaceae bacterium]|nr:lasso peptide biosynthesis B2 protein [Spirochaetaceae bacterium]